MKVIVSLSTTGSQSKTAQVKELERIFRRLYATSDSLDEFIHSGRTYWNSLSPKFLAQELKAARKRLVHLKTGK